MNLPEFSRAASKEENFLIIEGRTKQKGSKNRQEKSPWRAGDSSPVYSWAAAGRTIAINAGLKKRRHSACRFAVSVDAVKRPGRGCNGGVVLRADQLPLSGWVYILQSSFPNVRISNFRTNPLLQSS
jgi:hypothetical protein